MTKQVRKNRSYKDQTEDDPAGAFSWDMVANRVTSDAEVARLFGFSTEAMAIGVPIEQLIAQIHRNDRARVARAIHAAILNGNLYRERYRVTADGIIYHWVFSAGRCFGHTDGLPTLWTGFVCEVAEPCGVAEEAGAESNVVKFRN